MLLFGQEIETKKINAEENLCIFSQSLTLNEGATY